MRKSKGKFTMVKPSPFKKNSDVDTTWADSVYTQEKVDDSLKKSGHHTEKKIRGKKNTDQGAKNVGGGNLQLGPSEF